MTSVTTGSFPVLSLRAPLGEMTNRVLPVLNERFWNWPSFSLPPEASRFFWMISFRESSSPLEAGAEKAIKARMAAAAPAEIALLMFHSFLSSMAAYYTRRSEKRPNPRLGQPARRRRGFGHFSLRRV